MIGLCLIVALLCAFALMVAIQCWIATDKERVRIEAARVSAEKAYRDTFADYLTVLKQNSLAHRKLTAAQMALTDIANQNQGDMYYTRWARKRAADTLDLIAKLPNLQTI